MIQSNASKEILYIFLWLIGILFVYGLVHTFLLEPSSNSSSSNHAQHVVAHKSDKSIKQVTTSTHKVNVAKVVEVPKVTTPVTVSKVPTVTKAIHTAVQSKIVSKASTQKNSVTIPKANNEDNQAGVLKPVIKTALVKAKEETKLIEETVVNKSDNQHNTIETVKTVSLPKVAVPVAVHKVPEVSKVPPMTLTPKMQSKVVADIKKKSPTLVKTTDNIKAIVPKVQTVETLSMDVKKPVLVSIPSVPSTPSVPTVPTMQNSKKTATPVVKKVKIKEVNTLSNTVDVLEKELSSDEKMKLLDTAREHVREEAESARNKATNTLK